MRQVKMLFSIAAVGLLTVAVLTACKKNNDNKPEDQVKTSRIQAVHASPKTNDIEVKIGDAKLPDKALYLDQPKGYASVQTRGNVTIQVSAGGTVIAQGTHTLEDKLKYTLFVFDTLDAGKKVKYLLVQDTFPTPASGKSNIRFLHLAPQTGSVDIDMFKGSDSLRLVSSNAYTGSKVPDGKFGAITSGDYRVKVKIKTGATSSVILDVPSVKLESGKSFTLYLKGLTRGAGDNKLGLQLVQHK